MAFARLRAQHALRPMKMAPGSDLELRLVPVTEGLRELDHAPCRGVVIRRSPPTNRMSARQNRYLWAVVPASAPVALEHCAWARHIGLPTGDIKHSN